MFTEVGAALDDFKTRDVDALVTGLGTRVRESFGYRFPARPLLNEASRLNLPIALLSGHPEATQYISKDGDIVIPKQPHDEIAPALSEWLASLTVKPEKGIWASILELDDDVEVPMTMTDSDGSNPRDFTIRVGDARRQIESPEHQELMRRAHEHLRELREQGELPLPDTLPEDPQA